jgi:hypothetical protein
MYRLILCCIVVLFVLSSVAMAQTAKWTFMVYLAADNDLEPFGIADFNEMETVGSSNDLQIIVQMDRSPDYDATNGNWSDTRRFRVVHDSDPNTISSPVVQNLGEVNMGDPQSLVAFVNWAKQNYPADHYCLVLWDHGGGWRKASPESAPLGVPNTILGMLGGKLDPRVFSAPVLGSTKPVFKNPIGSGWGPTKDVCLDETDNDVLKSAEIRSALTSLGFTIDIVGYDACLMGMIENAYALRGAVNYMIGSEETEPGDGWPYDLILSALNANTSMTAAQLSSIIVQKYGESYTGNQTTKETQAAYDLSQLNPVVTALGGFVSTVTNASVWTQVAQAIQGSDSYNQQQHIDLYDFADKLGGLVSVQAVKDAANTLKSAITNLVIQHYTESGHAGSHGVAIYCPPSSGYDPRYANGVLQIDFTNDTQWDEFLQAYYQAGAGGQQNVDPYEPNDAFAQAYGPITSGFQYNGYITARNDVDIFKFVTGSTFNLRVDLTVPADYDMYLLRRNGDQYILVDSSLNMDLQPELIQRSGLAAGEYYVAVLYLYNNDNFSSNPYQLQATWSGGGGNVDVVLGYDDGEPSYGIYSDRQDMNEGLACYFTPPTTPALLKGFYYYLPAIDAVPGYGDDGSFFAFGADYYGPILPDTFRYVTPAGTGWNFINLSGDNITLYGDFFAGMFWDRWNTPMIGWDTNATNGLNLIYTESGGVADWFLVGGTFFVRAEISYVNNTTGLVEERILDPVSFKLSQNHPNPFNPSTVISYSLGTNGYTTLKVYDVVGREVATLVNEAKPPGEYTVQWDASNMPSGTYFYRLQATSLSDPTKTFTQTRKLVLLK